MSGFGTIAKAFVEALRASNLVDSKNISVVLANDDGYGIVNTALPAIAITMKGTDKERGAFIGGMIDNEYVIQISVITPLDNPAASPDDDMQYEYMNLPYQAMLYLSACYRGFIKMPDGTGWDTVGFFDQMRRDNDFNLNYRGTETYQTARGESEMEVEANVTRLVYVCKYIDKTFVDNSPMGPMKEFDLDLVGDNIP